MPRYKEFRAAWMEDENCQEIQKLSECADVWREGDMMVERAKDKQKEKKTADRAAGAARVASGAKVEEKEGPDRREKLKRKGGEDARAKEKKSKRGKSKAGSAGGH